MRIGGRIPLMKLDRNSARKCLHALRTRFGDIPRLVESTAIAQPRSQPIYSEMDGALGANIGLAAAIAAQ